MDAEPEAIVNDPVARAPHPYSLLSAEEKQRRDLAYERQRADRHARDNRRLREQLRAAHPDWQALEAHAKRQGALEELERIQGLGLPERLAAYSRQRVAQLQAVGEGQPPCTAPKLRLSGSGR